MSSGDGDCIVPAEGGIEGAVSGLEAVEEHIISTGNSLPGFTDPAKGYFHKTEMTRCFARPPQRGGNRSARHWPVPPALPRHHWPDVERTKHLGNRPSKFDPNAPNESRHPAVDQGASWEAKTDVEQGGSTENRFLETAKRIATTRDGEIITKTRQNSSLPT